VFSGIALPCGDLPVELVERHGLRRRVYDRGGATEFWFLLDDYDRALPVWHHGRLQVVRWGNRRGQSSGLPCTAWTQLATVEAGGWADYHAEPVVIPAAFGLDSGVWFHITQGVRGVLVRDEHGQPVVYVVCEPASHYYAVMTKSSWAPVLVGQVI
jgi:hypothetical protein